MGSTRVKRVAKYIGLRALCYKPINYSWQSDKQPILKVFTIAYGTCMSACCRVARTGMLKENELSKNAELILPVNTLRVNNEHYVVLNSARGH